MSFLKKLFPFLFKSEKSDKKTTTPSSQGNASSKPPVPSKNGGAARSASSERTEGNAQPSVIVAFGIVGRVRNARGLRKGSKAYVRSILEDGERVRIRGTAPNGNKVTITVPRRSLHEYESEGVPEHVAKHYDSHSLFKDEHEAKVKAEALGKH